MDKNNVATGRYNRNLNARQQTPALKAKNLSKVIRRFPPNEKDRTPTPSFIEKLNSLCQRKFLDKSARQTLSGRVKKADNKSSIEKKYTFPIDFANQKNHLEIEAEFNKLAEEWRAETRMLSLVTQKGSYGIMG